MLRGGIPRPMGDSTESPSRQILVGIFLGGRIVRMRHHRTGGQVQCRRSYPREHLRRGRPGLDYIILQDMTI